MENEIAKVCGDEKSLNARICDTHIARENGESQSEWSRVARTELALHQTTN